MPHPLLSGRSLTVAVLLWCACNPGRVGDCPEGAICAPVPMPGSPGADDHVAALGQGGQPFDPGQGGGLKLDPAGALVLDPGPVGPDSRPLIWVANSGEGTVSKIDTRTMTEVARYLTGPGGVRNDPSRTTVGLFGDAVVANRAGGGLVHIAGSLAQCRDRDGDGRITTSTGPGDVKAWGADECVLWYLELPAGSYPRAAVFDAQYDLDGLRSTTVYVGTFNGHRLYRIDASTGLIRKVIDLGGATPYGAAIDRNGVIWLYDASGPALVFVDVARGDRVGRVRLPSGCAYGIAVDAAGQVWTAGGNCLSRYTPDPADPATGRFATAGVAGATALRGLAVDGRKNLWIADTELGVVSLDTETMELRSLVRLGRGRGGDHVGAGGGFVGVSVDHDGKVWAIHQGQSQAYRIDPDLFNDVQVMSVGQEPYTYSDMTGFQLRNAAAPSGRLRHVFPGCAGGLTRWTRVSLHAEYPEGTSISVSARAGSDPAELLGKPWVAIGTQPPDPSPMKLDPLGPDQTSAMLEIEIQLRSRHLTATPRLSRLEVAGSCTILK